MVPRTKHQLKWVVPVFTILLCAALAPTVRPQPSPSPATDSPVKQKLEEEKLRQETIKLELENRALTSWGTLLLSYSTLVTVLVAMGGLIATLWKQIGDSSRDRNLDREQRQRDLHQRALERQQREDESRRRLEEKFTAVVGNLGSDSVSIQASAAVSIMTFLNPKHKDFHDQVFLILLANLKVQHRRPQPAMSTEEPYGVVQAMLSAFGRALGRSIARDGGMAEQRGGRNEAGKGQESERSESLSSLLVAAFQKAMRMQRPPATDQTEQLPIDLSRSYLNRVDLSNLNLRNLDLAFSELRSANLTGSDLFRVRGFEVHLEKARLSRANLGEARLQKAYLDDAQFHETNLVAADLKAAHLKNAEFQNAQLQSAHFDGADLSGAKFEQANLSDAFFANATLTPATLKSILKSFNQKKAHFDPSVREELDALEAKAALDRKPGASGKESRGHDPGSGATLPRPRTPDAASPRAAIIPVKGANGNPE